MDQTQFQQYCRAQGLTPEACDLIAYIRLSQPVRRIQGRMGNVSGFYPSKKMRVTIQFESQSVELGAIYLMSMTSRSWSITINPCAVPVRIASPLETGEVRVNISGRRNLR